MMTDKEEIRKTVVATHIMGNNFDRNKPLGEGLSLYKAEFPENYARMLNSMKRQAKALNKEVVE